MERGVILLNLPTSLALTTRIRFLCPADLTAYDVVQGACIAEGGNELAAASPTCTAVLLFGPIEALLSLIALLGVVALAGAVRVLGAIKAEGQH